MFGRSSWDIYDVEPPWGDRPSLFQHVRAHIRPGETGLTVGGDTLPDEEQVRGQSRFGWVAGGLDGAFGHHGGAAGSAEQAAGEILEALHALAWAATGERAAALYVLLTEHSALEYVDPLLEAIVRDGDMDLDHLQVVARWLGPVCKGHGA